MAYFCKPRKDNTTFKAGQIDTEVIPIPHSLTEIYAEIKAKKPSFTLVLLNPLVPEKLKNILIILRIHHYFSLSIPESLKYIRC